MMVNDLETATIAQQSKGIISDRTIIANHVWVDDLEQELERIEEEKASYIDLDVIPNEPTE